LCFVCASFQAEKSGFAVIFFVKGSAPSASVSATVAKMAQKYKKERTLRFFWLPSSDTGLSSRLAAVFGVSPSEQVSVVAFNAGKQKFAAVPSAGTRTIETVPAFLDSLLGGSVKLSKASVAL
jgi:hypothetical protein